MKKTLTLFLLFAMTFCFAQEKAITIDYTVKYLIPKKGNSSATDTITVGFEKDGKYIWTNSKSLAKDLGRSILRRNNQLLEESELAIIYDTENASLMMCFKSGKNEFFMNFELSAIIPGPMPRDGEEEFELISENTKETISIAGRKATFYDVYPSHKEGEALSLAVDESTKVNNNLLFKKFFELMFASEDNSKMLGFNIPDGLIMKVENKGETMIEAHKVDTTQKTININYSFKIKE